MDPSHSLTGRRFRVSCAKPVPARSNNAFLAPKAPLARGAGDRNRTRNLLFTKQLLCQLSYAGTLSEG